MQDQTPTHVNEGVVNRQRKSKRSISVYQNPIKLEKSKLGDQKNKSGDANKAKIKAQNKSHIQIRQRSRQDTIKSGFKGHGMLGISKTNVRVYVLIRFIG